MSVASLFQLHSDLSAQLRVYLDTVERVSVDMAQIRRQQS